MALENTHPGLRRAGGMSLGAHARCDQPLGAGLDLGKEVWRAERALSWALLRSGGRCDEGLVLL